MELKIANDVLDEMDSPGGVKTLNPAERDLLISVISKVIIYIIQNCILNKMVANNPTFIQKTRLRLIVNRMGRNSGLDLEKRETVYDALLKKGLKVTEAEINETLAEAGNN